MLLQLMLPVLVLRLAVIAAVHAAVVAAAYGSPCCIQVLYASAAQLSLLLVAARSCWLHSCILLLLLLLLLLLSDSSACAQLQTVDITVYLLFKTGRSRVPVPTLHRALQ
jgi:hypothetical protein